MTSKIMKSILSVAIAVLMASLTIITGIRIVIMYQNPVLALTLGLTLMCTVLLAKTIGCILPLIAKKCGLDPALMAAPLITTLVDTGTILIYFTIASKVFAL